MASSGWARDRLIEHGMVPLRVVEMDEEDEMFPERWASLRRRRGLSS
jgi:hypothetical protein